MRLALAALLLAAAALDITWCIRYAWAAAVASQETIPNLRRAIQLTPDYAGYYARLASLDPSNGTKWIDSALKLQPTDPVLWMERSVRQEVAGHPAAAEASLLEAARRDRQYVPRWALAAFYFRQRNLPKFQESARQALEMAFGDALPLFQMAAVLGLSLDDVRRTMLPDRPPVLAAFLSECLRRNDFPEALRTATRLIQIGKPENRPTVLAAIDALYAANRIPASVDLWNRLAAAHWIDHAPITPAALIPNPDFSHEFLPAAFDWHQSVLDGVVYWRLGNGRGLQIELSGREPETCTLLTIPLPTDPSRTYTLQTQVSGFPKDTGLEWKLGAQHWEAAVDLKADLKSPPGPLTLVYNRALGTKRIEGTLNLRRVAIGAAQ